MGQPVPIAVYLERIALITIITFVVQRTLKRESFQNNCHFWKYVFSCWTLTFGLLWLNDLKTAQDWSKGRLSKFIVWELLMMCSYLIGDFLEDLWFKDMNVVGGIWHNWGTFWPPVCVQIFGYLLRHQ